MPEDTRTLGEKLAAITESVRYLEKDGYNKHFDYRYVSAEKLLQCVNKGICDNGLHLRNTYADVVFSDDWSYAKATVGGEIADNKTGEFVTFRGDGEGKDKGDKASSKATTMGHKYAYTALFCIAWGDDPECSELDVSKPDRPAKAAPKPNRKVELGAVAKGIAASIAGAESVDALGLVVAKAKANEKYSEADAEILRDLFKRRKTELEKESK